MAGITRGEGETSVVPTELMVWVGDERASRRLIRTQQESFGEGGHRRRATRWVASTGIADVGGAAKQNLSFSLQLNRIIAVG